MKQFILLTAFFCFSLCAATAQVTVQIPNYKQLASVPGAKYNDVVSLVREKFSLKEQQLIALGVNIEKNEAFREEVALFERWALELRDKVGNDGTFLDPLTGWINAMQANPEMFRSQEYLQTPNSTSSIPWTSIGPVDNGNLNGWTYGGGIGRVNVVKRSPVNPQLLFAGTALGGLFKSTDLGSSWAPTTDQFAGLGVSDLAFLPGSPNSILMATGDYDGSSGIFSIGIFKTIDGGNTWVNKLPFTLDQKRKIAHLYVDPGFATNNTIWATGTFDIYKSTDQGETWASVYNNGSNYQYNDFVRVGSNYFTSGEFGSLFKSTDGVNFTQIYTHPAGGRVDFAYSPNTPDILYILTAANPAFSKYIISTGTMGTFTVVNNNSGDAGANYNSQGSYNQVLTVNPANGNDLMIGEMSGKRSLDGGATWNCTLNGYYIPGGTSGWGGGYVHSDHHYMEYIGASFDSLLIGNDGGVYLGPASVTPFAFKESVNGLTCTQSYSLSIFDAQPNNIMIGNQDNDGRSRYFNGTTSTWYAGTAGDGVATAIHRSNKDVRFLTGTNGTVAYRTDGYVGGFQSKGIDKPNNGIFDAPFEMHLTNGNILYGGFSDIYKSTGIVPSGDPNVNDNANWVSLNTGLGEKPKFIALANHPTDPTKQRIITIGDVTGIIRKSVDETTWSTVAPPAGVTFNSVYWSRNSDTMIATARGYNAASKVFFSTNAGNTWSNISDNMPNIIMQNVTIYEGTDTVFVSTELGVYFARLSPAGGLLSPQALGWAKFGTGLPNVKVADVEISYAKKQMFIATFGRGVWMIDLKASPLPISNILFTYNNYNADHYSLVWKIDALDVMKTTLQKSTDGINFSTVESFLDGAKLYQPSYVVAKESGTVYYRLHYTNGAGNTLYSQTIALRNGKAAMKVSAYPNPTRNYLNVSSDFRMSAVRIASITGIQLTYSQPHNNFYTFDMSLLPIGTYVVQVWDADGNMTSVKVVRD